MLSAKIAGKSHIVEPGETTIEIEEMLSESEKLMSECTMTWEQKEKQTEKIQQVIYIEIVSRALNSIKKKLILSEKWVMAGLESHFCAWNFVGSSIL